VALTLISEHNITSAVSSLEITSGLDSTYDVYEFHCYNLVTGTAWDGKWSVQFNAASGSNTSGFDQVITSARAEAHHNENGTQLQWGFKNSWDESQSNTNMMSLHNETTYQALTRGQYSDTSGNDGYTSDPTDYLVPDGTGCGIFRLYAPSSDTYVKHFTGDFNCMGGVKTASDIYTFHAQVSGYVNTTEPIDEIKFYYHNGTWGSGTVYMYGVS
jgi:hypothetical protein